MQPTTMTLEQLLRLATEARRQIAKPHRDRIWVRLEVMRDDSEAS